ncbi:MAG: S-layer homology domain-containing protein, partial [Clostridia bacterium]
KYSFTNVPEGVYSLVVTNGGITITKIIKIEAIDITADIKLPKGEQNTVVETKPDTPPTAAEGLNELFDPATTNTVDAAGITASDITTINGGGSVTVTLTSTKKAEADVKEAAEEIKKKATGEELLFLDFTVTKVVTSGGTTGAPITMTELPAVVEIVVEIPEALRNAATINVYSMHNNVAKKFADAADSNGEYAVRRGNYMHVFAKYFSTYALGCTACEVTIKGGGAGASGAGSYAAGAQVTINAGTKSGHSFSGWTVTPSTVALANPSNASTTFIMPAENVTVTANWTSTGGGSTGGDGSATTTYPNTVNKPENGTVTTNPASPSKGQTVTITTKPDAGYVVDTVIVKDADGKTVAVTKNGENSYTFVQPGSKATVEVTYKKAGTKTFTDVTANDWFYNAVMDAAANGWFSGTSATTFDPYASTTRGMIATVLQRVDNTPKATTASFDDVAADAYYASGVAWAQANNIVKGYGDGNYGPNDSITREQLAAILYRYAGYKGYDVSKRATLDSFTDGKNVSDYAKEAMSWAVGSGLISGRGNNILAPTATATRAEVASILVRFDELFT